MERRLVKKMIQQCFLQYEHQLDTVPLGDKDYERFYDEITKRYVEENIEIREIIEDVVYKFLVE
jgi:hypothetical protein